MQWTNDRNYSETQTDVYQDVKTSYSATLFGAEQTQEFSLDAIKQKLGTFNPVEEEENLSTRSDVKPSDQTLRMSYARDYSASQAATKSRLSVKTKVAIASYAVVVLALILAVTLCGVSVSSSFGAATALNAEYVESAAKVAELSEQITEDYAALAEKAAELGYIDASRSNTQTYTEIETRPAQNFNVETNWFDSLCDWLSGAFGG